MKITFVVQDLVGQGVQYATAIIARAFAAKGNEVEILVSKVNEDKLAAGGQMFELPCEVKLITMPYRKARQNILFIRRYLKECHPDVFIVESEVYAYATTLASIGKGKPKLPRMVYVHHGIVNGDGSRFLFDVRYMSWARIMTWFVLRKFHSICFVNEKSTCNFMSVYGDLLKASKIMNVNNAGCDDVFHRLSILPPNHPWLVNKICPTFIAAGSYTYNKRFKKLIEAVNLARKKTGMRFRLILFGRGPEEQEYRNLISKHELSEWVSLGGFSSQLPAEINASDGLVSMSMEESFGITLLEGLASGVPVLSTDAPYGPREILADGKYGRLVPIDDVEAMANALLDLAKGRIPVAPSESWQRYTIDRIFSKYVEAIQI